jgi:hypothetical protein
LGREERTKVEAHSAEGEGDARRPILTRIAARCDLPQSTAQAYAVPVNPNLL